MESKNSKAIENPPTNEVAHPAHYNSGPIEVIEGIEAGGFGPGFRRGNAIKYISRAGKKDPSKEIQDLEKAAWYLNREIEVLKAAKEGREPKRPNDMNPRATSATAASTSETAARTLDTAAIALIKAADRLYDTFVHKEVCNAYIHPSTAEAAAAYRKLRAQMVLL